jgi:hypothetical protein
MVYRGYYYYSVVIIMVAWVFLEFFASGGRARKKILKVWGVIIIIWGYYSNNYFGINSGGLFNFGLIFSKFVWLFLNFGRVYRDCWSFSEWVFSFLLIMFVLIFLVSLLLWS